MADTAGDPGEQSAADAAQSDAIGSATASGEEAGGIGDPSSDEEGLSFSGVDNSLTDLDDKGFFGNLFDDIKDDFKDNKVANALTLGNLVTGIPALGIMGLMARVSKAFGTPGTAGNDPGGGDGGPEDQIQQVVPSLYNPIEDMVGSDYVAYGGVGANELRKQLFPYMNFNQPSQPGISGLVGQYAGTGQGTGLMTGPFGMSSIPRSVVQV